MAKAIFCNDSTYLISLVETKTVYPTNAKTYYKDTPFALFSVLADNMIKMLREEPTNSPPKSVAATRQWMRQYAMIIFKY